MAITNMVPVDFDKLTREFSKRGLVPGDIAETCGYARGYFATAKSRSQISPIMRNALQDRYDIRPEEYAPDPKPEEPAPETHQMHIDDVLVQQKMDEVLRQLREAPIHVIERDPDITPEVIEEAVYNGIVRALTENGRFSNLLYHGIFGALKRLNMEGLRHDETA